MDIDKEYPLELFVDCNDDAERAARIGRFLILEELGYFGKKTNVQIAQHVKAGTFIGRVVAQFSNTYGDMGGCEPADIEVAAEMLGVFDDVFDVEASVGSKHLPDKWGYFKE